MMHVENASSFTEPRSLEDFGITLSKYFQVALALNRFPENVYFSLNDLAEKASVHRNTTKKALIFFGAIKPIIPNFKFEENNKVQVKSKPRAMIALDALFFSPEIKITSKMLLGKATSKERGLNTYNLEKILTQKEIEYLTTLIRRGFVNSDDGYFYLSSKGTIIGNLGIKKLVDSGIPLPWEESEETQKTKLQMNPEKMGMYYESISISTWNLSRPWKAEPTYAICTEKSGRK